MRASFEQITPAHRYSAARALENVEDWHEKAGRCVSVTLDTGKRGKFPALKRVWVNSAEADRARRGLRVPDHMQPQAYRKLIHQYLTWLLRKRVGASDHVLTPL